jgi:hypothetical protein
MAGMRSSQQIVEELLEQIAGAYRTPENSAASRYGLDCQLSQLHWLYAFAIDQTDRYAEIRMSELEADPQGWRDLHESFSFHEIANCREDFREVIKEWQSFDAAFGIRPPDER